MKFNKNANVVWSTLAFFNKVIFQIRRIFLVQYH